MHAHCNNNDHSFLYVLANSILLTFSFVFIRDTPVACLFVNRTVYNVRLYTDGDHYNDGLCARARKTYLRWIYAGSGRERVYGRYCAEDKYRRSVSATGVPHHHRHRQRQRKTTRHPRPLCFISRRDRTRDERTYNENKQDERSWPVLVHMYTRTLSDC